MKFTKTLLLVLLAVFTVTSCMNTGKEKASKGNAEDKVVYNDTFKIHTNYYEGGKLVREKSEIKKVIKDGKEVWQRHGRNWIYYKNGNLQSIILYENNRREGVARQFYGDGETLYIEWPYKNSKKDGVVKKYYESGRVMSEMPYKQNFLGTGSQDYADDQEHTALTMPELKVWSDDQRRYKGTYIVYAKVVDKYGKTMPGVKFTQGQLIPADGKMYENPNLKEIKAKNNVATIKFYEVNGFPESVPINARVKTNKGTAVLLHKTLKVD